MLAHHIGESVLISSMGNNTFLSIAPQIFELRSGENIQSSRCGNGLCGVPCRKGGVAVWGILEEGVFGSKGRK
jgi:hypothetical protein